MIIQSIRRAWIFVGLLALLGAVFPSASSAKQRDADRYIVVFKDSVDNPANLARTQTENRDADLGYIYRHAAKGYSAELTKAEVEGLRKDSRVDFVSRDHELELFEQSTPTGVKRIFASSNEALDIDEENDHQVDAGVAVIDTGIAGGHPDLEVFWQFDCTGGGECKGGSPGGLHGTHVAGIIGALDNDQGVVGVAPGVRLWSVAVNLAGTAELFESSAMAGVDIVTAYSEDIDVANMSFGCTEGFHEDCFGLPALESAITKGVEAGVVFVAAAGNEGSDASNTYPASHPAVIAVSALNDSDGLPGEGFDSLASFSNFGSDVDVAAPGVNILSTVPGGKYESLSGTSMAAPYVAGAAAILAQGTHPNSAEDVEAIRDELLAEGNFNWLDTSGDGIKEPLLDVSNEAVFNLTPGPDVYAQEATNVMSTAATLEATVNPRGLLTTYQFEYGKTTSYGSKAPVSPKEVGSGFKGVEIEEQIEGLEPGTTYHFRVSAENEEGTSIVGDDRTFTTADKPKATTDPATAIEAHSATLEATVDPEGLATTYQFEYGTDTKYGSKVPASPKSAGSGTSNVEVSETIGGLEPETTYHFRVVAENAQARATAKTRRSPPGRPAGMRSIHLPGPAMTPGSRGSRATRRMGAWPSALAGPKAKESASPWSSDGTVCSGRSNCRRYRWAPAASAWPTYRASPANRASP